MQCINLDVFPSSPRRAMRIIQSVLLLASRCSQSAIADHRLIIIIHHNYSPSWHHQTIMPFCSRKSIQHPSSSTIANQYSPINNSPSFFLSTRSSQNNETLDWTRVKPSHHRIFNGINAQIRTETSPISFHGDDDSRGNEAQFWGIYGVWGQ